MINNINNTNTIAPEDDEPQLGILFLLFKVFYGKKMKKCVMCVSNSTWVPQRLTDSGSHFQNCRMFLQSF